MRLFPLLLQVILVVYLNILIFDVLQVNDIVDENIHQQILLESGKYDILV
jgi:hypothetical protein